MFIHCLKINCLWHPPLAFKASNAFFFFNSKISVLCPSKFFPHRVGVKPCFLESTALQAPAPE